MRRFAVRQQGQIVSGSFDRCVQLYLDGRRAAVEVIDFKTDAIAADDANEIRRRVDGYRPQLLAYRHAASELFGLPLDRVAATLAFTAIDLLVDVR